MSSRAFACVTLLAILQASGTSQEPVATSRLILVKQVLPIYPTIAQGARVSGVVVIEASVSPGGRVTDAKVVESVPLLDDAALGAIVQWQFGDSPSTRKVRVSVRFVQTAFGLWPERPAAIRTPWLPEDFAFVYSYTCDSGHVLIESAYARITERFYAPWTVIT